MPQLRNVLFVAVAVSVTMSSCGGPPQEHRTQRASQRATPLPLPTRNVPENMAFSLEAAAERFPEFVVEQSGPFWVQLTHRQAVDTTIAIGVEPRLKGSDLEAALGDYREGMDPSMIRDSGTVDDAVLGQASWVLARFDGGSGSVTNQLALFAAHPVDGSLLLARSEFPSDGEDVRSRLDELVAITSVIGPGL